MRQLIIDLSTEKNQSKKNQISEALEDMGIEYHTSERPSLEEYNNEISEAEDEIAKGEFIPAENLKKEVQSW
jgi:hypothetical protein